MAGLEALLVDELTREIVGRLGEDVEEYSHGSKMGDGIAAGRKRGELGVVDFLKPNRGRAELVELGCATLHIDGVARAAEHREVACVVILVHELLRGFAQRRQLALTDAATFAGLTVVSDLIAGTDRFLSFN